MKSNRGFTLVEVMTVLGIVALLSVLAIPNLARARHDAENAKTAKELQSIYAAIVTFQVNNNFRLPISWNELSDYISISNVEQKYELNAGG